MQGSAWCPTSQHGAAHNKLRQVGLANRCAVRSPLRKALRCGVREAHWHLLRCGHRRASRQAKVGSEVWSSKVVSGSVSSFHHAVAGSSFNVPSFQSSSFALWPSLALRHPTSYRYHQAASVTSCGKSDAVTAARFPRRCARR